VTSLLSHVKVIDKQYPPRAAYEHLIEKTTDRFEHWYWEDDVHVDTCSRTPVFYWRPTNQGSRGIYVVARLLWVEANPGNYKRLRLHNTCGVYTCVNPAHWENPDRVRVWTLPGESAAELVRSIGETDCVHIRTRGAHYMVCGTTASRSAVFVLTERVPITCETCLRDWQQLGRLLEEVPHVPP
jgi:hypothetical protein